MAYQHERAGRKKARDLVSRTGHHLGKLGGHMRSHEPPNGDYAEDKKLVDSEIKKAMREHDSQLHGKGHHTRLKLADGGSAEGPMAESRSDRAPRGKKGHKGAHTNVNVIVAGGRGQAQPTPIPVPVPHPTPAGGPTPPPSMPPGGPPPGAMPPAMPMGVAPQVPPRPPMPAPGGMPPGGMPMRKHGGRAPKHDPEIVREAKEEGESYAHEAAEHGKRAAGGRAYKPPHMTAGAASGIGRREKNHAAH